MNQVKISIETLNRVLNYLSERPYKDVADIITTIVTEVSKENSQNKVEEQ